LRAAAGAGASRGTTGAARFADIDGAVNAALAERRMPGAVFRIERNGAVYEQAYGRLGYAAGAADVTARTLFDAASLTKVVATAPSVLLLAEQGRIDLDARLVTYFPACGNGGKDAITVRQLLTHTSGCRLACTQAVTHPPGTLLRYSDINYLLLGQLVQRVAGVPLDQFA
jgi:CubicO group peptidase (beta-lactamase class C family)